MKFANALALGFSLFLSVTGAAQTAAPSELSGVRFGGPANPLADSNATFAIGLTPDSGGSYRTSARVSDTVRIVGKVRPEAGHVGQKADIFLVDRINLVFMMKNRDGLYLPWNGRVPDLVPYLENVTLTAEVAVDIFDGRLATSGDHRLFLGYLPAGGQLRYSPVPHRIEITTQSADDQALAMFSSTISPNIVQTRCIFCHVAGGLAQAGGAYHIFRQPLGTNVAANYDIFKGLVDLRGVNFILSKVTGGNAHGGGVQLTSGSVDYADLQTFLNLVAQGLPAPGQGTEVPDNYNPYGY